MSIQKVFQMKCYRQLYLIVHDRGFKYQNIANVPEFNTKNEAVSYWNLHKKRLQDCNFYDDPIVIIRREIHDVKAEEL